MSRGSKAEDSFIGKKLQNITDRLDHLERKMQDLTKEGSIRVLDRMHELEQVTRDQCNDLLRIMYDKSRDVAERSRSASSWSWRLMGNALTLRWFCVAGAIVSARTLLSC